MDLINEKDTWHNLSSSLFSPFGHFLVDLFSHLWLDFSDISSKKSHKSLGSRVNNINLMESDGMDHLFSLLKLTLWALHVSGLWPTVVEVAGSCEGTTQLRNLTRSLVDGDDVTAHNFFFLDGLDHLGTKNDSEKILL